MWYPLITENFNLYLKPFFTSKKKDAKIDINCLHQIKSESKINILPECLVNIDLVFPCCGELLFPILLLIPTVTLISRPHLFPLEALPLNVSFCLRCPAPTSSSRWLRAVIVLREVVSVSERLYLLLCIIVIYSSPWIFIIFILFWIKHNNWVIYVHCTACPKKKFTDFLERLDDIFQNCFRILKLVVCPRHLKKSYSKKVTGSSMFEIILIAVWMCNRTWFLGNFWRIIRTIFSINF